MSSIVMRPFTRWLGEPLPTCEKVMPFCPLPSIQRLVTRASTGAEPSSSGPRKKVSPSPRLSRMTVSRTTTFLRTSLALSGSMSRPADGLVAGLPEPAVRVRPVLSRTESAISSPSTFVTEMP